MKLPSMAASPMRLDASRGHIVPGEYISARVSGSSEGSVSRRDGTSPLLPRSRGSAGSTDIVSTRGLLPRSRRGSVFVEATMVLPLLILSILTCVLISMFFYETTIRQCQLHEALRSKAGEVTGLTTTANPTPFSGDDLAVSAGNVLRYGNFKTVSGTSHTAMIRRLLLYRRGSADTESCWHACDGVTYVRYFTLIKNRVEEKLE